MDAKGLKWLFGSLLQWGRPSKDETAIHNEPSIMSMADSSSDIDPEQSLNPYIRHLRYMHQDKLPPIPKADGLTLVRSMVRRRPDKKYEPPLVRKFRPHQPILRTRVTKQATTVKWEELRARKQKLLQEYRQWADSKSEPTQAAKVVPLDAQARALVQRYWSSRGDRILGEAHRVELSLADLKTLKPRNWLNDNIIDLYLADVTARAPKTFAFTTHFFTRLEESGYSAVGKWAKRKKINVLELEKLIVPVNCGNMHWCVAVVDNRAKTMAYYDSLSSRGGMEALQQIMHYMFKEAEKLYPKDPERSGAIRHYKLEPRAPCPQQSNGYDCGVFASQVAGRLAQNAPLDFSQNDIDTIREHMAHTMLKLVIGESKL